MSYRFIIWIFRLFNLWGGHRIVRHGAGRLPSTGGAVVAVNHTSYVDFAYIGLEAFGREKRYLRILAKAELARSRVLRFLMKGCGVIAVDRSAGRDAYLAAVQQLQAGELVVVYPEATISLTLAIKELKTGAARMALESGMPIYPVIVWGSQRIAPKGAPKRLGRTKTPVMVSVGEPLPAADTPEDLTERLSSALSGLLTEVKAAYGPYPGGPDAVGPDPGGPGGAGPSRGTSVRPPGA